MRETREYPTVEYAFQAQKNEDDDFKDLFTKNSDTYIGNPKQIKKVVTTSEYEKTQEKDSGKM